MAASCRTELQQHKSVRLTTYQLHHLTLNITQEPEPSPLKAKPQHSETAQTQFCLVKAFHSASFLVYFRKIIQRGKSTSRAVKYSRLQAARLCWEREKSEPNVSRFEGNPRTSGLSAGWSWWFAGVCWTLQIKLSVLRGAQISGNRGRDVSYVGETFLGVLIVRKEMQRVSTDYRLICELSHVMPKNTVSVDFWHEIPPLMPNRRPHLFNSWWIKSSATFLVYFVSHWNIAKIGCHFRQKTRKQHHNVVPPSRHLHTFSNFMFLALFSLLFLRQQKHIFKLLGAWWDRSFNEAAGVTEIWPTT